MNVQNMLMRFRPMLAPDDTATAADDTSAAAAVVDQIIADKGGADDAPDADIDLGLEQPGADEIEWEDLDLDDDMKVRVPKGKGQSVREGYLRQTDYSRNIQEAKKLKADYETRTKTLEARTELDSQISEGSVHLKMMDTELQNEYKYFQSPDWAQLQQDDPIAAQQRWNRFQMNERQRGQLASALMALGHRRESIVEANAKAEADAEAKRREQLPREIAKLVPGWNADMLAQVEEFAVKKLGYEPEALKSSTEPKHFWTLHLARIGQAYLDAKARQGKGAVIPAEVKPTKTVGGRGAPTVTSDPKDSDDMESWMKKETAREQKARAAR